MTALARAFRNAAPGKTAGTKYTVSTHANRRIIHRVGVAADEVMEWVNRFIDKALLTNVQRRNGRTHHIYEADGWQLVVDQNSGVVVTILPGVDVSFLRPIFDRERRKLQREITRKIRELELEQALILEDIAKHAINRARAKNPNTRELIQRKIDELQPKVGEKDVEMERQRERLKDFETATKMFI